jgi:catechol 2,3-dioxygenase-like lactoylglutathione lyase family enzyme
MALVDHIVYSTPDLDATVAEFTRATGVRPEFGGSHPGMGTRNAQVALGGCYLELIGPDPDQPEPAGGRPLGVDSGAAGFVAFAVRPAADESLDQLVARAAAAGTDLGPISQMGRRRPDGVDLRWRLTMPRPELGPGVPFLIDWGETPQPSDTVACHAELTTIRIDVPEPEDCRHLHDALGLNVPIEAAPTPALVVTIRGPAGPFGT